MCIQSSFTFKFNHQLDTAASSDKCNKNQNLNQMEIISQPHDNVVSFYLCVHTCMHACARACMLNRSRFLFNHQSLLSDQQPEKIHNIDSHVYFWRENDLFGILANANGS